MEVHLSPKQEQELAQLASRKGRQPKELAEEAIGFYLQHEARFVEAVRRGLASADNGQLIEHEEVLARIDRLFACRWGFAGHWKPPTTSSGLPGSFFAIIPRLRQPSSEPLPTQSRI
jgi:predicted transcriptional regulator